jgi:hypothetical protein
MGVEKRPVRFAQICGMAIQVIECIPIMIPIPSLFVVSLTQLFLLSTFLSHSLYYLLPPFPFPVNKKNTYIFDFLSTSTSILIRHQSQSTIYIVSVSAANVQILRCSSLAPLVLASPLHTLRLPSIFSTPYCRRDCVTPLSKSSQTM